MISKLLLMYGTSRSAGPDKSRAINLQRGPFVPTSDLHRSGSIACCLRIFPFCIGGLFAGIWEDSHLTSITRRLLWKVVGDVCETICEISWIATRSDCREAFQGSIASWATTSRSLLLQMRYSSLENHQKSSRPSKTMRKC